MTYTGTMLRSARKRKNIGQKEISEKLGLNSAQFISNIERGICLLPVETAKVLHEMLDIPKSRLVWAYKKDSQAALIAHIKKYETKLGK